MSDTLRNELANLSRQALSRRRLVQTTVAAGAVATLPASVLTARAQEPLTIAFSVPGLNFPFFVHMMNLAQAHADELGVEMIQLDGQENGAPSSSKQSADLEAVVAQGVDGIVISPNDVAALAPRSRRPSTPGCRW